MIKDKKILAAGIPKELVRIIQSEFDVLSKAMIKDKKILAAGIPKELVRISVD
eukprot:CAMPEP_0194195204 /NCGR_PEP_ID=MMETSP0154-20130528/76000_1 /TAXON_ID=1049557 /ORGANISM="Thalassiothrix antarctica, Strain L6-D1" /LENGTH=52 /DNA_ID=CAMNT_0038919705 /DNA_START=335 /DNA_END=493 /DNA_ORIENTATION=+